MFAKSLILSALPLLTAAHFTITYPPSRGGGEEEQEVFPCGGFSEAANRTLVPLDAIPVSVVLGHTENLVQITLAVGNEVGEAFNTELLPTVQEYGPGDFCLPALTVPAGLNITDGTNATIQVITNSHDGSGLYNCADITFSSTAPEPPSCVNGTGVSATPLPADAYTNANETESHEHEGDHGAAESSASASDSTPSETASGVAASATGDSSATLLSVGWGLLGMAVLGCVTVL